VDFYVIDQLPIIYSAFVSFWKEMGVQWDSTSDFIDFKKTYDTVK
jgi:hypothetical protein